MHAINGGWVGQTFALTKCNDSGGKKSRIRRSKEERKELVVSFIKKYQSLNNGNFPSLNLTHKEVGGSFYTVREIVRQIIQENLVLGPAKLLLDEQNGNRSSREYPLGTISVQPESYSTESLNGTPFVPDLPQSSGRESDLMSDGFRAKVKHQELYNEQMTNGSIAMLENGKFGEVIEVQVIETLEMEKSTTEEVGSGFVATQVEDLEVEASTVEALTLEEKDVEKLQLELGKDGPSELSSLEKSSLVDNEEVENPVGQLLERESSAADEKRMRNSSPNPEIGKSVEEVMASKAKVTQITDIIVETFPLRPVIKSTDYLDANSGELSELSTKGEGVKEVRLGVGNGSLMPKGISHSDNSFPANARGENLSQSLLEGNSTLVDDKVEDDLTAPLFGSSSSPVKEVQVNGSSQFENNEAIAGTEVVDAPSSIQTKTLHGTPAIAGGSQSTVEKVLLKDEAKHSGCSEKGGKATLERINIESWEGASAKQQTNPLLSIFKVFLDAFIKFWSQ